MFAILGGNGHVRGYCALVGLLSYSRAAIGVLLPSGSFGWSRAVDKILNLTSMGIAIFFMLVLSRSKFRSYFISWSERGAYEGTHKLLETHKPSFVALPYLLLFWLLLLLFGFVPIVRLFGLTGLENVTLTDLDRALIQSLGLKIHSSVAYLEVGTLALAQNWTGIFLILCGIIIHFTPTHSRELKYFLLMSGLTLSSLLVASSHLFQFWLILYVRTCPDLSIIRPMAQTIALELGYIWQMLSGVIIAGALAIIGGV
jgi:hypothetical protein